MVQLSEYIRYCATVHTPSDAETKLAGASNLVLDKHTGGYAITEAMHFWRIFRKIDPLITEKTALLELGSAPDSFRNIALHFFKWKCRFDGTAFGDDAYRLLTQTYAGSTFYQVNFDPSIVCPFQYKTEFPPGAYGLYDIVLCTEVIEHLYNPYPLLKEIYRLLKPGGVVYITTNNSSYLEKIVYALLGGSPFEQRFDLMTVGHDIDAAKWRHVRYYSKKQLSDIVIDNGFEMISSEYFQVFSLSRRGWKEIIKRCLAAIGTRYRSHFDIVAKKPVYA
jgi:SAM-dependent methyltransferase